jgi:hypothetical protein
MGRSISVPTVETSPSGAFEHGPSDTVFRVSSPSGAVLHEMERSGRKAVYSPRWTIGSGNHGSSYVIAIGDALFQSPISWYTMRQRWDLSPGFENDAQPDFFRPVTADCFSCHAGSARPHPGTLNRYFDPPFQPASIGCDRCHGDPAGHLADAKRSNIVNPARLEPARRDAVCEQCHLSGEARIPHPGKAFSDFRPGMRMEQVFSVYVKQTAGDLNGLKVVSHSEQMVRSACFMKSKTMWCGSCHDPHRASSGDAAWYRDKCLGCHESERMTLHRVRAGEDCASCHMPTIRAYDGGHTAFTDHQIRVSGKAKPGSDTGHLRAWREPDETLRNRNLGLAYISVAARDGSASRMLAGLKLLGSEPADGAVETARGLVLLRTGKAAEAVQAFRRAVDEQPADSTRRLNLAAGLLGAGLRNEAKRNAEEAIMLEPLLEDAYALLAEIEPERAKYWKERYKRLAPQRVLP